MSDETYNGWTNYETWVTKLWIDNSQSEQEYWLEEAKNYLNTAGPTSPLSREDNARYQLAEALQASYEATADEYRFDGVNHGMLSEATLYSDLMTHALGNVNWHEIAASLIEEAKELS